MTQEAVPGVQSESGGVLAELDQPVLWDVRIVAWRTVGSGTVAALQEVFGLDVDTAQQLVSRVPAMVKRGVSSTDAQAFMQALESVGAQVMLRRSGGPITLDMSGAMLGATVEPAEPAYAAVAAPPPPAASQSQSIPQRPSPPLPTLPALSSAPANRPYALPSQTGLQGLPGPAAMASLPTRPRPTSATLSGSTFAPRPSGVAAPPQPQPTATATATASGSPLDLMGNDGRSAGTRSGGARRSPSGRLDGGPLFTDMDEGPKLRREGQRELELDGPTVQPRLEIERNDAPVGLPSLSEMNIQERLAVESTAARTRPLTDSDPQQPAARKQGSSSGGASAQAAVRSSPARVSARRGPSRLVAVRQILIAMTVVAGGLWFDNSMLRGDASSISLAVHAFGIYQLGLGIRGLLS